MGIKRFSYYYARRKLPGDSTTDARLAVPFLFPSTDRRSASIGQRAIFAKKDEVITPTRTGKFYLSTIKEKLLGIFSAVPSEQLRLQESYPAKVFQKRALLFDQWGVIKDENKPGNIRPPTTEEIHLQYLLKTGKRKVWSIGSLFRRSLRPSWVRAKGFVRFDMTWLGQSNLATLFPKARAVFDTLGIPQKDCGVLITRNGRTILKSLQSLKPANIANASRIHFVVKSKYRDYRIRGENYLSLMDITVGKVKDFVDAPDETSFVSLGMAINRLHVLQVEKRVVHPTFDLVVMVPSTQVSSLESRPDFKAIAKRYKRILLLEMDDNDFAAKKIGYLTSYSHSAISEYSHRALIFGPREQQSSDLTKHIIQIK